MAATKSSALRYRPTTRGKKVASVLVTLLVAWLVGACMIYATNRGVQRRLHREQADRSVVRGDEAMRHRNLDDYVLRYEEALRADPDHQHALNNLAWFLATCPEARFRDGMRSVELATRACELTNYRDATFVDTLAASYAEIGQFESAVRWQRKAVDLIEARADSGWVERLRSYEAGRPHREPGYSAPP